MNVPPEKTVLGFCILGAIVLALSFALPFTVKTTYIDADGRPVGFLAQTFPDPSLEEATSYEFVWDDFTWDAPLVFFLPVVLLILIMRSSGRLARFAFEFTPIIAALLLFLLSVRVYYANFSLFAAHRSRAFGGYVALGALTCFLVATIFLVFLQRGRLRKSGS